MKPIGKLTEEFRLSKGWNSSQMAKAVGTSRQNIESLEAKGDRKPHYIVELAKVMGVTVDELLGQPSSQPAKTAESHPSIDAPHKEKDKWPFEIIPKHRWDDLSKEQKEGAELRFFEVIREIEGKTPPKRIEPETGAKRAA